MLAQPHQTTQPRNRRALVDYFRSLTLNLRHNQVQCAHSDATAADNSASPVTPAPPPPTPILIFDLVSSHHDTTQVAHDSNRLKAAQLAKNGGIRVIGHEPSDLERSFESGTIKYAAIPPVASWCCIGETGVGLERVPIKERQESEFGSSTDTVVEEPLRHYSIQKEVEDVPHKHLKSESPKPNGFLTPRFDILGSRKIVSSKPMTTSKSMPSFSTMFRSKSNLRLANLEESSPELKGFKPKYNQGAGGNTVGLAISSPIAVRSTTFVGEGEEEYLMRDSPVVDAKAHETSTKHKEDHPTTSPLAPCPSSAPETGEWPPKDEHAVARENWRRRLNGKAF